MSVMVPALSTARRSLGFWRYTWSQFLLSQKVHWRDLGFALTGVLIPLGLGIGLPASQHGKGEVAGVDGGVYLLPGMMGFVLVWIVYNVVNSATSRRGKLIYKRLRGTPLPDTAIMTGEALSGSVTSIAQAVVLLVFGLTYLGAPAPANPLLLLVGVVLGAFTFALLAIGVSGLLPTSEVSTWIVTPFLFLMMFASGIVFPLSEMPHFLQVPVQYLPSSSVVEILRTAYLGRDFATNPATAQLPHQVGFLESFRACVMPLGLLCAWIGVSLGLGKRFFKWDPKRSS
jgi:ABC-2 type transport system permease protein